MKKTFLITMSLVLLISAIQPAISQRSKTSQRRTKKPTATSVEKSKQEGTKKADSTQPEKTGATQSETSKPKTVEKVEEPPIQNIKQVANVSAKITRSSFKSGNATSPSWQVSITVKNLTNKQLELGESLVILETARVFPLYAGNYGLRELEQPTGHVKNFKDRYLLDWGYTADTKGFGFIVFPVSYGSGADLFMALLSSATAPSIGEHEGTGYGQVKPRTERTFMAEIPTPTGIAKSELRDQIIVVLPRMRVLGNTVLPMSHTIFRFNVGDLKEGDTFNAPETSQIALTPQELRTIVIDDKQPIWLRLFALNWFAETDSKEAAGLLLQYGTANISYAKQDLAIKPDKIDPTTIETGLLQEIRRITTAYVLQISSIVNLGTWKIKSASTPLAELLQKTDNRILRLVTIEALGEIGDPTTASSVRPFIKDSDEDISNRAIEAVGQLKDPESVSTLLEILVKGKESSKSGLIKINPYDKAATALGSIGSREAIDGLLGVMRNSKETQLRVAAARALGNISSSEVTASLMAVISDSKTPGDVKTVAISNLSKIGGPDVIAAIRIAAESDSNDVRRSAISALAAIKDPAAASALIALAERANYPSRDHAISNLGDSKITDALPTLRKIVIDKQSPADIRISACTALAKMQDKQAKETLLSVADDSDEKLYSEALNSLSSIYGNEASPAFIASLKSKHESIRRKAADIIKEQNAKEALPALWSAYQIENDRYTGGTILSALIALKFADQSVVPFLASRIDEKKNPLWSQDLDLLLHLNSTESIAVLRNAAESTSADIQRAAIEKLIAAKTPAAITTVIALAQRNGYPSRDRAIYELKNNKVTEALPAFRAIVKDYQSPSDIRQAACSALATMEDKQSKETLLSVADDSDASLYEAALNSLDTIFGSEAGAAFIKGLSSKHERIRRQSASHIRERKPTQAVEPLWQAYQIESEAYAAGAIAAALIELKFSTQDAVPFLINRLDPKKNKLWYEDVRLLRQITGEKFGPDYEYVGEKARNIELEKWRTWWANKNKPQ